MADNADFRRERARAERRRKRAMALASAICAAVVVVALVGGAALASGFAGAAGEEAAGAAAEASGAAAADATVEVVDSLGRTVRVPADPQCIAAFDSFCGEMAVMAGADERIAGLPAGVKSDLLLGSLVSGGMDDVATLSGNAVNIEELMAMDCDVALVKTSLSADERAKLDEAGIPYVAVGYTTMAEQIEAMRLVGRVCGPEAAERADGLAAYYEGVVADVQARTQALRDGGVAPVRVFHAVNDPLLTDAAGSLGADWVSWAGCEDVSAGEVATSGTDYAATPEQLYVWQPDLIICNAAAAAETFRDDTAYAALGAVEAGRVEVIPTGATRWGQRGSVETYLALLWLGCTAYPDAYADVDLRVEVEAYYRDYLGIEVDDDLWGQMVSGLGLRSAGSGDGTGSGSGGGR